MNALRTLRQHHAVNATLFAVLSAAGFSMKAIFVKLAYATGQVDALTLLALRMALSLPLFLGLVWLSRGSAEGRLSASIMLRILVLGLLGYYLASLFDFYGLEYISAGLERLILFTYPTLVLIFQLVALRERPSARTLLAMGVCYVGLGVALLHDISTAGLGSQVIVGAAWVFASALSFALYYMGTGMLVKRLGSMRLAGLVGTASALMVLLHYGIAADFKQLLTVPGSVWFYAGLMALISTVLPIYWMTLAIQRLGATHTAAIGNLGPMLTILAAWLLLDESISIYQLAGMALVLFGVSRLKPAAPAQVLSASQDTPSADVPPDACDTLRVGSCASPEQVEGNR